MNIFDFKVPVYEYPKTTIPEYASILVPNVDNTRTDYLIHALAKQSKVVFLSFLFIDALLFKVEEFYFKIAVSSLHNVFVFMVNDYSLWLTIVFMVNLFLVIVDRLFLIM